MADNQQLYIFGDTAIESCPPLHESPFEWMGTKSPAMDQHKIMTIALLECYIEEFKRPSWLSCLGFYDQKDRVEKAEKHLNRLKNSQVVDK